MSSAPVDSGRLFTATTAQNEGQFAPRDWVLFLAVATIWGSSFLLMAIGLDSFEPGLVTLLRVGLGAVALWMVPQARHVRIDRHDWPRLVFLSVVWVAIPFTLFPIAQQYVITKRIEAGGK